mgnify:CR=1 FL=1
MDPASLFDIQAKRLHEYKRQLLKVLHIITLYNRLCAQPELDSVLRTFIFGAKSAPGYQMAEVAARQLARSGVRVLGLDAHDLVDRRREEVEDHLLQIGVDDAALLDRTDKMLGVILLGIVNNQPRVFTLKEMLHHFVEHRHVVITRRTQYDLDQAQAREHILEGLKIAVDNIDAVIKIIRGSETTEQADERLRAKFFPDARQRHSLEYAIVRDGKVALPDFLAKK